MAGNSDSFDYSDSFDLDISGEFSSVEKTSVTSNPVSEGASSTQSKVTQDARDSLRTHPWLSQKPPTAGKKTSIHNNIRAEHRRKKSPIYKVQHLRSRSEGRVDQTPTSPAPNGSSFNQASRPLCFKEVAALVHTMHSASKEFNTSREVRDFAYKEWLAKKREKVQEKGLGKNDKTLVISEEKRKSDLERMDRWLASKKTGLQARNKQQADKVKTEKMDEQEKRAKILEGEISATQWRKVNYKQLVKTHRQLKEKKEKEDKRKMEEMVEKEVQAKCAFESWKQQKDLVVKEKFNKMKSQTRKLEKRKKEQAQQEEIESQTAYENWKVTKDKDIKANKNLDTYNDDLKKIHKRVWCPARSMQYSYPQSKENKKSKLPSGRGKMPKPANGGQTPNSMDSYSNASFEYDEFEEDIGGSGDSTESSSSKSPVSTIAVTGTHKSIQVCCQTLQYWCTCKDTHIDTY